MKLQKKKLTAYSTLAATFIAIGNDVDAQVIYTDLDPDVILTENGDRIGVDIDNNGTNNLLFKKNNLNFTFTYPYGEYTWNIQYGFKFTRAELAEGNSLAATYGSSGYPYPFMLDAGDIIDGKQDWISSASQILARNVIVDITSESGFSYTLNYLTGYWEAGSSDKYLGMRVKIDDQTYYGWIRLSITDESESLIIHDYAINMVPGAAIEAGQTEGPDAIQSLNDQSVIIYSHQKNVYVNIASSISGSIPVRVFNIAGETVYQSELQQGQTIVSLDAAASGIYTIQLQAADGVYTKKIQLQ